MERPEEDKESSSSSYGESSAEDDQATNRSDEAAAAGAGDLPVVKGWGTTDRRGRREIPKPAPERPVAQAAYAIMDMTSEQEPIDDKEIQEPDQLIKKPESVKGKALEIGTGKPSTEGKPDSSTNDDDDDQYYLNCPTLKEDTESKEARRDPEVIVPDIQHEGEEELGFPPSPSSSYACIYCERRFVSYPVFRGHLLAHKHSKNKEKDTAGAEDDKDDDGEDDGKEGSFYVKKNIPDDDGKGSAVY